MMRKTFSFILISWFSVAQATSAGICFKAGYLMEKLEKMHKAELVEKAQIAKEEASNPMEILSGPFARKYKNALAQDKKNNQTRLAKIEETIRDSQSIKDLCSKNESAQVKSCYQQGADSLESRTDVDWCHFLGVEVRNDLLKKNNKIILNRSASDKKRSSTCYSIARKNQSQLVDVENKISNLKEQIYVKERARDSLSKSRSTSNDDPSTQTSTRENDNGNTQADSWNELNAELKALNKKMDALNDDLSNAKNKEAQDRRTCVSTEKWNGMDIENGFCYFQGYFSGNLGAFFHNVDLKSFESPLENICLFPTAVPVRQRTFRMKNLSNPFYSKFTAKTKTIFMFLTIGVLVLSSSRSFAGEDGPGGSGGGSPYIESSFKIKMHEIVDKISDLSDKAKEKLNFDYGLVQAKFKLGMMSALCLPQQSSFLDTDGITKNRIDFVRQQTKGAYVFADRRDIIYIDCGSGDLASTRTAEKYWADTVFNNNEADRVFLFVLHEMIRAAVLPNGELENSYSLSNSFIDALNVDRNQSMIKMNALLNGKSVGVNHCEVKIEPTQLSEKHQAIVAPVISLYVEGSLIEKMTLKQASLRLNPNRDFADLKQMLSNQLISVSNADFLNTFKQDKDLVDAIGNERENILYIAGKMGCF